MTTPLEKPITITFSSKEQFAAVHFGLSKFAAFLDKIGDNDADLVHDIIGQGRSQWDCGDPNCADCHPENAEGVVLTSSDGVEVVGVANLLRLLGMPPEGEA